METFCGKLFEGERLLAHSIKGQKNHDRSGYFTLPPRCTIDLRAQHKLVYDDGDTEDINITRLSQFTGDVDFEAAM